MKEIFEKEILKGDNSSKIKILPKENSKLMIPWFYINYFLL